MIDKLTKEDLKWLKSLPHTAFMSHAGFKRLVMSRLGIPYEEFANWVTPYPWLIARDKEVKRRFPS